MTEATEDFKELLWTQRIDPPYYVNSAAISAAGDRVVAGTFYLGYSTKSAGLPMEFGTYCFDSGGKQIWADRFQGAEGVYAVAVSADGTTAASGGRMVEEQGFIRAYEAMSGQQLANYSTGARVNQLALSRDGETLVAAADQVYLAQRTNGVFPQNPSTHAVPGTANNVQSVSAPLDGSWFVIGDKAGTVYLIENDSGQIGNVYPSATGLLTTVHCVAASGNGEWFVAVGYSADVYLFNTDSIQKGGYVDKLALGSAGRTGWAAISLEGGLISVVQNDGGAGRVYFLENDNGVLSQLWSQPTLANPNSTSMDASGEHVTVADGYPDGTPGHFYLFNGQNGEALWSFTTPNMNWPMFISSSGNGIAAGTDDGIIYYFTPK